jgi:outer membrane protein TolC
MRQTRFTPVLVLAAALAVSAPPARAAAPVPPLPDPDTAHQVLAETPAVQAALAAREAARARGEALDAGPYEFELDAVGQRRDVRHEGDYGEWEAGISRRLRLPGKAALDRELGALGNEVAELGIADAFHGAARELLDDWLGWLDAASAVAAAKTARERLAEERAAVDQRLAHGDAARLDLDLAESALAGAEAALAEARAVAAERSAALGARYPTLPLPAAPPPIPDPEPPASDAAALAQQIVARSHEIGIAEARYQQSMKRAQRGERDRRPDPALGIRTLSERGGDETAGGLTFNIPIGGRYRAAEARALAADAGAAGAELDAVRRQVVAGARAVTARMQGSLAAWRAARRAAEAAAAHVARARRGYELGETDLFTLLAAERTTQDARRAEIAARIAAHRAVGRVRVDAHELWAYHHHPEAGGHDRDPTPISP